VTVTDRVTSQGENQHLGALVLHVPPPLHYGAAFAAGMLLRAATVPLALGARPPAAVIGAVVLAAGAALALAGIIEVMRHQTTIVPQHAVSALVTTGAYRISRNPMYAGLAIAYLGGALLAGSWWPLATFPLALLAVRDIVIGPEGQTYLNCRTRVRRWL
jgi:protein-S-isoprenylcysteine O-methyltransferase Ste14